MCDALQQQVCHCRGESPQALGEGSRESAAAAVTRGCEELAVVDSSFEDLTGSQSARGRGRGSARGRGSGTRNHASGSGSGSARGGRGKGGKGGRGKGGSGRRRGRQHVDLLEVSDTKEETEAMDTD